MYTYLVMWVSFVRICFLDNITTCSTKESVDFKTGQMTIIDKGRALHCKI